MKRCPLYLTGKSPPAEQQDFSSRANREAFPVGKIFRFPVNSFIRVKKKDFSFAAQHLYSFFI